MHRSRHRLAVRVSMTCVVAGCVGLSLDGCQKQGNPQTAAVPTDQTVQSTTPPPTGDITPKAVDDDRRVAAEANEKPGDAKTGSQTTVGTAASGAPPYSLQGAPEGNVSSKKDAPKK